MNVAIVAGEASGDKQAANLLRELSRQLSPSETVTTWGIGGPSLQAIGCELLADSRTWGTIGIVNSLRQPATILAAMRKFKQTFDERRPDLLILVDFGAFNIPLAKWVKDKSKTVVASSGKKCPIFYYFPPSSWRRKMSLEKLRKLTSVSDLISTPFSWSEKLLRDAGGNAYFLGHPLLDSVQTTMTEKEFDDIYGVDDTRTVITLVPGSREHEVHHILPVLLSAAGEIARRIPGVQFLVAKSPNLPNQLIEDTLRKTQDQGTSASLLHLAERAGSILRSASNALSPPINERVHSLATPEGVLIKVSDQESSQPDWAQKRMSKATTTAPLAIVEGATHDAMARADLVIAASGTATLEAAILGRPVIIVYRGSGLMNLEYKIRRRTLNIKYVGLPNILAEEMVCPELLQNEATSENIANHALDLLLQPERMIQLKARMLDLVAKNLGEKGATQRTASMLIEFLRGNNILSTDLTTGAN